MALHVIRPPHFSDAHKAFLAELRAAVAVLSAHTDAYCSAKDTELRHSMATDRLARAVGLRRGPDIEGLRDAELPCAGVARHGAAFEAVERELMRAAGRKPVQAVFSILPCAHGLIGLLGEKSALIHAPTDAVLGTFFMAQEVAIADFMALLPNYFHEFGVGCVLECAPACVTLDGSTLPEYEHEVAFLISVGWRFQEIAAFMDFHRPHTGLGRPDALHRCIGRIGMRMHLDRCNSPVLRELLVGQGLHRRPPPSLFRELAGPHPMPQGPWGRHLPGAPS